MGRRLNTSAAVDKADFSRVNRWQIQAPLFFRRCCDPVAATIAQPPIHPAGVPVRALQGELAKLTACQTFTPDPHARPARRALRLFAFILLPALLFCFRASAQESPY